MYIAPICTVLLYILSVSFQIGTASPHGQGLGPGDIPCSATFLGNSTLRDEWFSLWRFLSARYSGVDRMAWSVVCHHCSCELVLHQVRACQRAPPHQDRLPHRGGGAALSTVPPAVSVQVRSLLVEAAAAVRAGDPAALVALAPDYAPCPGLQVSNGW